MGSEVTSSLTDRDWLVLLDSLTRGNCIALLGPDLRAPGAEQAGPALTTALSNRLARILSDEEHIEVEAPDDLPLVAQLFVDRKSRSELEVEVTDFYRDHDDGLKRQEANGAVFASLAALPFPLFVSSRHDLTLEYFLGKAGKPPVSMAYNFKGNQQITVGAGQTNGSPLVYHLFGSVSDPASLALTQRDLLDLLQAIVSGNPGLPTDLRNLFREKSFLFLGCGLHQYYLRILLHVLGLNRSGQRSFALEAATQESVWFYKVEYRTLKLLNMDATAFIQQLGERLQKRPEPGPGAGPGPGPGPALLPERAKPKVFISYVHEDEPATQRLRESLEKNDVEAWRDKEALRFTEKWANAIDDAISKEVDFFVVVLSQHISDGIDSYVHLEIERALLRRSRRGAVKFIYSLQIDEPQQRLDALDRAGIQTSRLRDFDADVTALAQDIRREYAKIRRR
jgi:hypothetical protein